MSTNCPTVTEEKWPRLRFIAGMMRDFRGNNDGKAKAASSHSMVERRCEESTYLCTRENVRAAGGQETGSLRRRGRAEGNETGNSVPVNQTESALALTIGWRNLTTRIPEWPDTPSSMSGHHGIRVKNTAKIVNSIIDTTILWVGG
jgi:hypothetical protein